MRLRSNRRFLHRVMLPKLLLACVQLGAVGLTCAQTDAPRSLTLAQAIDLALRQNRDLKLAQLSVIDRRHKTEIARAAYLPQIRNESAVLHITELAGVEVPAGAFGSPAPTGAIPAQNLVISQGSLTTYTSGTGLTQPLSQIPKIRAANRAAIADLDTARAQLDSADNDVALKVRQLYFGVVIAQLQLKAANEEIKAAELKLEESTNSVEQGRALEVTALESRAALLDARQAALVESLKIRDLTLSLNDLLGLPLVTRLQLDPDIEAASIGVPSRTECIRIARQQSPEILAAQQSVKKAAAGLAAARDEYIPDITALARYSYQSGVPFLVHNFGTFGFSFTYDVFDGGRRSAEIADSRALLSQAEINLSNVQDKVDVEVETAYDKVDQLQSMVGVAKQLLDVRVEAARVADRQYEQSAVLASLAADAHARASAANASLVEATLGLSLAQGELMRDIGQIPR